MPYNEVTELPESVREHLPKLAQEVYKSAFNSAEKQYGDESPALVVGGIFAALELAVEIAPPLVVWRSQNRLSGLPIAGGEAVALGPGRFSFTQLQAAKI